MSDPRRLIDDPDAPEDLRRALEDAARHRSPFDPRSALRRFEAAQAAGGLGGMANLAVAGLAVALAGAIFVAMRPPVAPPAAPAVAAEEPVAAPPAPVAEAAPAAPVAEEEVTPPPARREARAAAPRIDPRSDPDSLAREMAELAEARRALDADPRRTLALVEAGRREFPRSLFGEERAALRVLSLAALDRDAEARRLGADFLRAHPSSPFAARVERAIAP